MAEVAPHQLAPRTYESYRHILGRHVIPKIGHVRLVRLTSLDVQRAQQETRLRPLSSHRRLSPGRAAGALNDAVA
uniref:Integrase SAM-like N-terminal domain-containing protein n=1 Tax=Thermomicrobium roseum TaxID=500 RepID=A0A7C1JWG2_THERO